MVRAMRAPRPGSPKTLRVRTRWPGGRLRTDACAPWAILRPSRYQTSLAEATGPSTVDAEPTSVTDPSDRTVVLVRGVSMRTVAGARRTCRRPETALTERKPSLTVTRSRAFTDAAK